MESFFSNKTVLITGGTKGLGFATATLFARNGAKVYLSYRSDAEAAQLATETIRKFGTDCEAFPCDLSEENGIINLFNQLSSKTTKLDFYIHNAAATVFKGLLDLKTHHIDKTLNITIKSFILGVQHAVQLMHSGGAIVSVSGMDNLKVVPRHGLLGAAKSALETLTAYFAHELAQNQIRVNCINPGFFETESTRKYLGPLFDATHKQIIQLGPLKQPASLEDIANVILFLCSEKSKWIVGQTIQVDGGADLSLPFSINK